MADLQVAALDDPLARAMLPSDNETPDQRAERLAAEQIARQISDELDEEIRRDAARKKKDNRVKLLLLGQAESGKSTVLKNMKMIYAAEAFKKERASWPPIVHYNIIRHVVKIIRLLDEALEEQGDSHPRDSTSNSFNGSTDSPSASASQLNTLHINGNGTGSGNGSGHARAKTNHKFTTEHRVLCLRLKPLVDIEATVSKHLLQSLAHREGQEVCVHTYFAWNKHFRSEWGKSSKDGEDGGRSKNRHSRGTPGDSIRDEARRVLNASCKDILRLWNDPQVQELLHAQTIQLEHEAGFFLDDLERVTALDYAPTDLDVCKARLKTVGVTETLLKVKRPLGSREWSVYDVGGSRTQRASWMPFFEDVNAIVFLAPLSAFNQRLEELPSVNRLEDSLLLWRDICSARLLAKAHLILFLNKIDLLQKKLEQGVDFKSYLVGYNGSNEVEAICKYMKKKFIAIYKQAYEKLPETDRSSLRVVRVFPTSALDIQSIRRIIMEVETSIMGENLQSSDYL